MAKDDRQSEYPEPQIGFYHCECCLLDLYRIDDENDLESVRERIDDGDEIGALPIYATLAEAIERHRSDYEGDPEILQGEFTGLGWVDM